MYFYASSKCWPALGGVRPSAGLIISQAVVLTSVKRLPEKLSISGRSFLYSCELLFERLAPLGQGVSLNDISDKLEFLAGRANYGQALQRTPILLSVNDTKLIENEFHSISEPFEDTVDNYLPK